MIAKVKKTFKPMLRGVGWLLSCFLSPSLIKAFAILRDETLSYTYKRRFKSCGDNFLIPHPFSVLGESRITIGNNFCAFQGLRLEAITRHLGHDFSPEIRIGDNVSLNFDCHIGASHVVEIGNNVLFASRVFVTDHFHGEANKESAQIPPGMRILASRGPVFIEDDVWLGEGVCVLPGVRIGRGAIIGANAVVTRDVPAYGIAIGVPARTIRCYNE